MVENAPVRREWQNLKEISLPNDQIEDGIADLVKALIGLGIKTNESCEGHLKWNKTKSTTIKWQVDRDYVMPTIKASNSEELTTLQNSVSQFANFIFENYIKPKRQS